MIIESNIFYVKIFFTIIHSNVRSDPKKDPDHKYLILNLRAHIEGSKDIRYRMSWKLPRNPNP